MCPLGRMRFLGRRASSSHNNLIYAGPQGQWLSIVYFILFFLIIFFDLTHNAVNGRSEPHAPNMHVHRPVRLIAFSGHNIEIVGLRKYFFIAQVWFWEWAGYFFWGPVNFFGGPVSFLGAQSVFKSTGPTGHWTHRPNVKACKLYALLTPSHHVQG